MRHDLRWKVWLIFIVAVVFAFLIHPTTGGKIFKTDPLRLGLDFKGGIELTLEPDYRLGANYLAQLQTQLLTKLRQANIPEPTVGFIGTIDNNRYEGLRLVFDNASNLERASNLKIFTSTYKFESFGETKNLIFESETKGNVLELKVKQNKQDFPGDALERAKSVIANRINEKSAGMAEAEVRIEPQKERINVQLPGLKSLEQAQEIIITTARLTFRINNQIVLDGTDLTVEGVNFDQTKGGYAIHFSMKGNSAKVLAKITADNVGKNMAVYLDENELMNPRIESALPDGSGVITLGDAPKSEVDRYALLMKSGSLPISLRVIQSNQVAPTLGSETVKTGLIASIIGVIMVILFMLLFYGLPGLLADAALIIYATLVLGVMVVFRGVLTLPGLAGFILGIGMAVDANVIIFERIKDELRNGKRLRAAVEGGFHRAFTAILDSNLTTLIAAVVLLFYGTGPIQGFAVTLVISVLVSMFTAIFVTRVFIDWKIDNDPDRYAKQFGFKEVEG